MNLKELTLEQLKVLHYDQLAIAENAQINLRAINDEIRARVGKKVDVESKAEVKEESKA